MNREGFENTSFFVGTEVEHTPMHGAKTLFVVGVHSPAVISQHLGNKIEHLYFGANMSFPKLDINDAEEWRTWQGMVQYFLERDYFCTLDIDVTCVEGLLESGLCEYRKFIPMISVKLPYIQHLGYNATIKLDDKDFDSTNHGVWCHRVHNLMDEKVYTNWSKYTKDETL